MREHGIQGICRRKGRKNLVNAATAEDLVKRQFAVDAPDVLWLTDITEHPTAGGKLYCAAVMDAFARKIIGWSMGGRQDTALVVKCPGDGGDPQAAGRRFHHPAFGSRHAVYVMGIRETAPRRRAARLNGNGR
jgi:transposase InsO family protein